MSPVECSRRLVLPSVTRYLALDLRANKEIAGWALPFPEFRRTEGRGRMKSRTEEADHLGSPVSNDLGRQEPRAP